MEPDRRCAAFLMIVAYFVSATAVAVSVLYITETSSFAGALYSAIPLKPVYPIIESGMSPDIRCGEHCSTLLLSGA